MCTYKNQVLALFGVTRVSNKCVAPSTGKVSDVEHFSSTSPSLIHHSVYSKSNQVSKDAGNIWILT